jgi:hypothetical protein
MIQDSVFCIPTAKRPEFLALCLEKLAKIPDIEQADIRIFLDTCTDERLTDVEYCRDTFLPVAEIFRADKHVFALSGCWNILRSLHEGWRTNKEYVFFVEEDVLVLPTFTKFHWNVHNSGNYFVTCGRRHSSMPLDFYSNPGTCYRHKSLDHVVPHINDDYFRDTTVYLDKHFPGMKGMDGTLDDGLIRKVQRSVNGKVLCAEPPVAFHSGFHYYDRLEEYKNKGVTIQERIEYLRKMLPTLTKQSRYTHDWEPYIEPVGC